MRKLYNYKLAILSGITLSGNLISRFILIDLGWVGSKNTCKMIWF